jgi:hypothetical protein
MRFKSEPSREFSKGRSQSSILMCTEEHKKWSLQITHLVIFLWLWHLNLYGHWVWSLPSFHSTGIVYYGKGSTSGQGCTLLPILPCEIVPMLQDKHSLQTLCSKIQTACSLKLMPSWNTLCFIDFPLLWVPKALKFCITLLRMLSYAILYY